MNGKGDKKIAEHLAKTKLEREGGRERKRDSREEYIRVVSRLESLESCGATGWR